MIRFKQQEFSFLNPLYNIVPFSFRWYFLEWFNPTTVVGFDFTLLNVRYRFELYREIFIPRKEERFKDNLKKARIIIQKVDDENRELEEQWKNRNVK